MSVNHSVTVHGAPRGRWVYIQWGVAWFPKGIVNDTAITTPVLCSLQHDLGLGSRHILKENAGTLVAATRENGLEVCADKTQYMVMSREQRAGRNHSARINNSTFDRVEEFKCLGKI